MLPAKGEEEDYEGLLVLDAPLLLGGEPRENELEYLKGEGGKRLRERDRERGGRGEQRVSEGRG